MCGTGKDCAWWEVEGLFNRDEVLDNLLFFSYRGIDFFFDRQKFIISMLC